MVNISGGGGTGANVGTAVLSDNTILPAGGLTKYGAGTISLQGQNTYAGPTTITAGVLRLDFDTATTVTSNLVNAVSPLTVMAGAMVPMVVYTAPAPRRSPGPRSSRAQAERTGKHHRATGQRHHGHSAALRIEPRQRRDSLTLTRPREPNGDQWHHHHQRGGHDRRMGDVAVNTTNSTWAVVAAGNITGLTTFSSVFAAKRGYQFDRGQRIPPERWPVR